MVHLDYRDPRPIYSQIMEGIRAQIRAGVLVPGDKLPSVRELAGQLAINPNTIQRAYRELELQGWIASVAGKGCYVCGDPQSPDETDPMKEFDQLTERLLSAGFTREQLIKHLEKGGNENA